MAEQNSSGGGPSLNLNTVLALLTLVGSVWLVSSKLTSDRPVVEAGDSSLFFGEQTLEARLWEDPFKSRAKEGGRGTELPTPTNLAVLVQQIQQRSQSTSRVLLLPVMVSGGQYSEDQEARIRSRFAIVSALGQRGYAPEDAEHIGALLVPWPTQHQMDEAKTKTNSCTLWVDEIPLCATNSYPMDLRYEWYRPRTFFPRPGPAQVRTNVLVLWLDDSFFEDEPLLRLPLLLERLIHHTNSLQKTHPPSVALIGPRRSSTLRAMLPGPLSGGEPLAGAANTNLWPRASNVLGQIDLYCATPTAMDEVLVTNASGTPRAAVGTELRRLGFRSFRNFAPTDAQLAREVLDELALRRAGLTNTNSHLVLISEWDTFYARMLSLTYAAEMAVLQGKATSRVDFINSYISGTTNAKPLPPNFHSLVYLRGLDGQTIGADSGDNTEKGRRAKSPTTSFDELRDWVPDANKAEGRAQFDYLARLGDQLAALEDDLRGKGGRTRIAVGIVGSDVYDTLLILQALRHKFPNFYFFTTDLDARFWHPHERGWSRNLIVASGYGLALHPQLQQQVAPFRDSTQTAQFAATLAALGNTSLVNLVEVPPRRFEIGNSGPVDISIQSSRLMATNLPANAGKLWLHPLTTCETYAERGDEWSWRRPRELLLRLLSLRSTSTGKTWFDPLILSVSGLGFSLLLACLFWRPLRNRTFGSIRYLSGARPNPGADSVPGANGLAQSARECDAKLSRHRLFNILAFWAGALLAAHVLIAMGSDIWLDTFALPEGERFSLANGISGWPSVILRVVAGLLAIFFSVTLYSQLRMMFYEFSQRYRFSLESETLLDGARRRAGARWPHYAQKSVVIETGATALGLLGELIDRYCFDLQPKPGKESEGRTAAWFWRRYRHRGHWVGRMLRAGTACLIYFCLVRVIFQLFGLPFQPLRGATVFQWSSFDFLDWEVMRHLVSFAFLFLTFLTIDAARLCRWFIEQLSASTTQHEPDTREQFRGSCGNLAGEYLDEWISTQLIADLTERVGRLLWFPGIVFFLLLVARIEWWDQWPWHTAHIIIMTLNFLLALASVFTLQRAAKTARREAEANLQTKIKKLQAGLAASPSKNDADQAEKLLEEIHRVKRGAFVPFWENPVLGALVVGPGGLTLLQMLIWFMGR